MTSDTIKITSGEFRGRVLKAPKSGTHPMGSREKLALFNSLGPLAGVSSVLDCYCGSGALGLECLSRGVKTAFFVDKSREATKIVQENAATLGVLDQVKVFTTPVQKFSTPEKFDLIFVDPPYDKFTAEMQNFTHLSGFLTPSGCLILSHPADVDVSTLFPDLTLEKTSAYAAAHLSFFQKH